MERVTDAAAYETALEPLTAQQRRFVAAYLECLNASEAARRAGYKTKANVQYWGGKRISIQHHYSPS